MKPSVAIFVLFAAIFVCLVEPVHSAQNFVGLHADGNRIKNSAGQIVRLRGINKSGPEYACVKQSGVIFDAPYDIASMQAVQSWSGVNSVRIPMNEDCWLGRYGFPLGNTAATYQTELSKYVDNWISLGFAVIIELHWTESNGGGATGQQAMLNVDASLPFWTSVSNTFKNRTQVIFDVHNEPYPGNNAWDDTGAWTCWRDGGSACSSSVSFNAAGMQQAVNTVRATGATNLIMLGGLSYSNSIAQFLSYMPTDPKNNIAASVHTYDFNRCIDENCWNTYYDPVMQKIPVVFGEIGESNQQWNFLARFMPWLDARCAHYLGWTWNAWGCGQGPILIQDYSGTPCSGFGSNYKNWLSSTQELPSVCTSGATAATISSSATIASATSTSQGSSSSTTSSSACTLTRPSCNNAEKNIYNGAFQNGWANASWGGNIELSSTDYVAPGDSRSVKLTGDNYNAFSFLTTGFSTSSYNGIQVKINGGGSSGQAIAVLIWDGSGTQKTGCSTVWITNYLQGPISANTWQTATIPFSDLGVSTVSKVAFQAYVSSQAPVYFGNIKLVCIGATTTASSAAASPVSSSAVSSTVSSSVASSTATASSSVSSSSAASSATASSSVASSSSASSSAASSSSSSSTSSVPVNHTPGVCLKATPSCGTAPQLIYDGQLRNGWANWSWGSTTTIDSTEVTAAPQNTKSMKLVGSNYPAMSLQLAGGFSGTEYNAVSIAVNGGTGSGQKIAVLMWDGAGNQITNCGDFFLDTYIAGGGGVEAGVWKTAVIPFADWGLTSRISRIAFQSYSATAQAAVYFGAIKLVCAGAENDGGCAQTLTQCSTAAQIIFDDGLQNSWGDQSWGSASSIVSTPVKDGSSSLKFTPSNYNGISLASGSAFASGKWNTISFWLNGGSTGGQAINVQLYDEDGVPYPCASTLSTFYGGAIAGGTWKKVYLPIAAFGSQPKKIKAFYLSDLTGTNTALYLDNIQTECVSGTTVTLYGIKGVARRQTSSASIANALAEMTGEPASRFQVESVAADSAKVTVLDDPTSPMAPEVLANNIAANHEVIPGYAVASASVSGSKSGSKSGGTVAGIVIGVLLAVALVAAIIIAVVILHKKGKLPNPLKSKSNDHFELHNHDDVHYSQVTE